MTQVSRYGHMLKMKVDRARMHVTARYKVEGSVLDDTVQGEMIGVETQLELESPEPPEKVARLVRNAERGCFVMQGLLKPVPIVATTVLNGQRLDAVRPPSRSTAGRGSAPLATAAAAPSSCSRLEYPSSTVDTASEPRTKRSAASGRLSAWPSSTSTEKLRARRTSVA